MVMCWTLILISNQNIISLDCVKVHSKLMRHCIRPLVGEDYAHGGMGTFDPLAE